MQIHFVKYLMFGWTSILINIFVEWTLPYESHWIAHVAALVLLMYVWSRVLERHTFTQWAKGVNFGFKLGHHKARESQTDTK